MKLKSLLLISLLAASASQGAIIITEVMSSSAHTAGTNNGDWFELTNTGALPVDITSWSWDDNSNTPGSANFGSLTSIAAGRSVIFTQETLGAEASWISNWGLSGVAVVNLGNTIFQNFGSGGDALSIYDNTNTLVTGVTFGTATAGLSFEWDTSGNNLGLSVNGQNGAFVAASNGQDTANGPGVDVGSPGFAAIPEPSAALLGAIGALALLRRRR